MKDKVHIIDLGGSGSKPPMKDSTMSKQLDIEECKLHFDANAKKILANRSILAYILKYLVPGYEGLSISEISSEYINADVRVSEDCVDEYSSLSGLIGRSVEDSSVDDGTIRYDIIFTAKTPTNDEYRDYIINVEPQNDISVRKRIINRAMYYCARMLSGQKERLFHGSAYEDMHKVYSIWICPELNNRKEVCSSVTMYSTAGVQVIGSKSTVFNTQDLDLWTIILTVLGHDETVNPCVELLRILFSKYVKAQDKLTYLQTQTEVPITSELRRSVGDMKGLWVPIWEDGVAEGERRGEARGEAKGICKGEVRGKAITILNLMSTLNCTIEHAFTLTKMSQAEQSAIRAFIRANVK